jgi:hypothetical protein
LWLLLSGYFRHCTQFNQAWLAYTDKWKWSVPVWSRNGIICTGETYKATVKMTFAKGTKVDDPVGLFNASLEGNIRRAIDFHGGG